MAIALKPKEKKTKSASAHASPTLKRKMKEVKILSEKIMNARTVAVIDLKGMPNKIFYKIRKALLGHASIIVAKKAIILHALQECSADRIA
jgi:ribosomal protein L10